MHLNYKRIGITEKGDVIIQFDNEDHTRLLKKDLLATIESLLYLYLKGELKE